MTGIERLRAFARSMDELSVWPGGAKLLDIAGQIERELRDERDRWESDLAEAQVDWNRVAAVCLDIKHFLDNHENAGVSDMEMWIRSLRDALKSDASDERDAQNPSWHDPADAADGTSGDAKVTRDPADDVSMSAYDLLPQEEREAVAWVREHGGLDGVKRLLDWVVGHCSTKQQLDFDFWLSGRVMHELGFDEDMADRDEVERRLLARLMPDGYEWPRYETGEPVRIGDDYECWCGETHIVCSVTIRDGRSVLNESQSHSFVVSDGPFTAHSKCVKRPAKVLDADGVDTSEGDTVYEVEGTGHAYKVVGIRVGDGDPLAPTVVTCDEGDGTSEHFLPSQLTHQRPVADTWERIEEDAGCTATKYNERRGTISTTNQQVARDLVRRAKKLAERGE